MNLKSTRGGCDNQFIAIVMILVCLLMLGALALSGGAFGNHAAPQQQQQSQPAQPQQQSQPSNGGSSGPSGSCPSHQHWNTVWDSSVGTFKWQCEPDSAPP